TTNTTQPDFRKNENILTLVEQLGVDYKLNADEAALKICPKCDGDLSDPSNQYKFNINIQTGLFHCFRCHWKGNLPKFIHHLEKLSEQNELPTKPAKENREKSDIAIAEKILSETLDANETQVSAYLQNRGLSGLTHGLRFHPALFYSDDGIKSTHQALV